MTTLHEAASLSSDEQGLVVVSTLRANGTIQASLVNGGVLAHPVTGETTWPSSPQARSSWRTCIQEDWHGGSRRVTKLATISALRCRLEAVMTANVDVVALHVADDLF